MLILGKIPPFGELTRIVEEPTFARKFIHQIIINMKKLCKILVAMLVVAASLTGCQKKESSEKKILSFAFVSSSVQAVITESADNVWEYVEFIRGGSDDYVWNAVIDLQGAKVSMKNCTIDGSLGYGIDVEYQTRFLAFEGNTIKNCAQYPIVSEHWIGLLDMGNNNTFESNGHNFIDARCRDIQMEQHTTLKAMPIPYYMESGLYVNGGYKLTIEPGTQMYFKSGENVHIEEEVAFVADGTADKPIIFRGMEDENSYWPGIKYHSTKEASVMNHCQILNCGEDSEYFHGGCLCIYDGSRLTLTNCTIGKSLYYGITLTAWGCLAASPTATTRSLDAVLATCGLKTAASMAVCNTKTARF